MTVIAETTRIRMIESLRNGALEHHAHKLTAKWLERVRGSRLDPELMDEDWRDLKH